MNPRRLALLFFVLFSLQITGQLFAQETPPTEVTAAEPAPVDTLQQAREQLQVIQQSLTEKRRLLEQLRTQLSRSTDAAEKLELQARITREELDMSTLRRSFENIALGGVDSSVFDPARQNQPFDWQQELKLILEPVFQKMRELTDKPRQIEQLKSRIAVLESKLRVVNRALDNLERLQSPDMDPNTVKWLNVIQQAWTQQMNDIRREQDITELRLNVLLGDNDTLLNRIRESISQFISGTGRNLALATAAFMLTLLVMKSVQYLYNRFSKRNTMRKSTARRILTYVYQALTVMFSMIAALAVLYIVGDMVLLVIIAFLIILILLGMRHKLPFVIEETRMLLDVGPVREHERVIYRDLPWLVRSLGVYSYLNNPALEGVLRLPMSEMNGLVSRPVREDESWFPTRSGDWVLFADGTVGQVKRQTPDTVQLVVAGSAVSISTSQFLNEKFRNLSQGFSLGITFGIDYQHQAESTGKIPATLKQYIEQALQQAEFGQHVESVLVDFKEAAASSLNYLVAVTMNGAGASFYWGIGRLLQRACIDCSNANGWVIPFNQLTLNAGAGFEMPPGLKAGSQDGSSR